MKKSKASKPAPQIEITPEQRYHIVNDAAYFRALKGRLQPRKPDDQAEAWCEVEAEIDAVLKQHHAK